MPLFPGRLIAQWSAGTWLKADVPERITGFAFDSRKVSQGQCFVALRGDRDGHDYVAAAQAQGAACALVERAVDIPLPQLQVVDSLTALGAIASHHRGAMSGPVVGVTGSFGKTSTKELLAAMLGRERTLATPGNWNNRIGVPMTLLELEPEAHAFAVIEAGINEPGEMTLLAELIDADLVVMTGVGAAHLEGLGDLDGVAREKSCLLAGARAKARCVLPADCLQYPDFAGEADRLLVVGSPTELEAVPSVVDRLGYCTDYLGDGRMRLRIDPGQGRRAVSYEVNCVSDGMSRNMVLALAAARELGAGEDSVRAALEGWQPGETRGAIRRYRDNFYYIDCYNSNPDAAVDAVASFERVAPPEMPRCYVLGQMNELGALAEALHRRVGGVLRPRAGDQIHFVGSREMTEALARGVFENRSDHPEVCQHRSVRELAPRINHFNGALFIKGSRSLQLEQLLPADLPMVGG